MSLRYVEVRTAAEPGALSLDLARHLHCRLLVGRVVICCDRPGVFAPILGKRWASVIRDIEKERSRTLKPTRKQALEQQLAYLRTLRFTIQPPNNVLKSHIFVITPDKLHRLPAHCYTIYLTVAISGERLLELLRLLPYSGIVVTYTAWTDDYESAARRFAEELSDPSRR